MENENEARRIHKIDEDLDEPKSSNEDLNEDSSYTKSENELNKYKEFLDDSEEEVEVQEPFFYKIIMVAAAFFFLITVGVMTWGYVDVQNERKASLESLSMQKGEAVKLPKHAEEHIKKTTEKKLSFAEAQKQMKKPMERFKEHVNKTDEMSEKFLKDPNIAYTTEWKMDYQSHMKEIRESNGELQNIISQTEDGVLKDYSTPLNKVVEFTAIRYEAIVEKDQEKLLPALNIAKEVEKNLTASVKWFK